MKLYLIKQFSVTFITQTYLKLSNYCLISLEVSTILHQTYNFLLFAFLIYLGRNHRYCMLQVWKRSEGFNVLISGTKLLQKSYQSGRVFCSFRRKVMILSRSQLYMLDLSQNQHVIWATGPLAGDNLLVRHMFRVASGQPMDIKFMGCKRRVEFGFKSYFCKL